MDKDMTEEFEENVMSIIPETTTTTQGNLFRGIVNWSDVAQSTDYKDQNSLFDNSFSNNSSLIPLETKNSF